MGFLADGFESVLELLDRVLEGAHVPYSYGFSIILLTLLVKLATFPLSQKSMQSTTAMQALQPRVKELQARFANDPETLQLETAKMYREAGVNPLAGCLPTLATIPVFIGLYKALTKAADDGLLTAGFFWIPSLGGPTTLEMRQEGSGLTWLFPFVDGAPPIGWHDAVAYLILPVLLVASQYISQQIMSPKSDDPAQQQTQAILKFIPFMIGWFSLNVPSGLTLYWFVNNIISTAQQVYMKKTIKVEMPAAGAGGPVIDVSGTPILPKEEREKTATGRELGSRKKKGGPAPPDSEPQQQQQGGGGGGSRRGSKFAARKAQEAASKAAPGGQPQQQQQQQQAVEVAVAEVIDPPVPDAPPSKN
ncbi:MAG: inner membrane ALBINO3-like protein 2, chloroplast precursor [Monoraphidium minutum]|nr:MAG: inner membrane ALBINO3-like protein 2, chloroplast precursor [Monoraphidium minutum]